MECFARFTLQTLFQQPGTFRLHMCSPHFHYQARLAKSPTESHQNAQPWPKAVGLKRLWRFASLKAGVTQLHVGGKKQESSKDRAQNHSERSLAQNNCRVEIFFTENKDRQIASTVYQDFSKPHNLRGWLFWDTEVNGEMVALHTRALTKPLSASYPHASITKTWVMPLE